MTWTAIEARRYIFYYTLLACFNDCFSASGCGFSRCFEAPSVDFGWFLLFGRIVVSLTRSPLPFSILNYFNVHGLHIFFIVSLAIISCIFLFSKIPLYFSTSTIWRKISLYSRLQTNNALSKEFDYVKNYYYLLTWPLPLPLESTLTRVGLTYFSAIKTWFRIIIWNCKCIYLFHEINE